MGKEYYAMFEHQRFAHPHSLIRLFSVGRYIPQWSMILWEDIVQINMDVLCPYIRERPFFPMLYIRWSPREKQGHRSSPLRKHAYSNISKISLPQTEKISVKSSDTFHISAQNIDCGYVLTSTHNLCFRAKIRKIMYTPVNPSFTI